MNKPEQYDLWFIEDHQMDRLMYIRRELFGNGRHLDPDHRRDLANMLNTTLMEIEGQGLMLDDIKQ